MTAANEPASLAIAVLSDTGAARVENQDFAYAGPLPRAPGWTLLAVADGLGGHARGDWASERAVTILIDRLGAVLSENENEPARAFEQAIAYANKVLYNEARDLGWPGSATTLVAALIRGAGVWWMNVGDSRMYRFAGGMLEQVSADHSVVAERVRAGLLSADAALTHPHRNVVTRTVGFEPWVEIDTGGPFALAEGDGVVLCSDGLCGPVADIAIEAVLRECDPADAAARLIALANDRGGPDNITVAIAKLKE